MTNSLEIMGHIMIVTYLRPLAFATNLIIFAALQTAHPVHVAYLVLQHLLQHICLASTCRKEYHLLRCLQHRVCEGDPLWRRLRGVQYGCNPDLSTGKVTRVQGLAMT